MPLQRADLVYNAHATHVPAWVWDVALDSRGRPVIVYATFPSNQRHEYWYADWTGTRWVSHFLTIGGGTISPGTIEYEYSGGIALDHSDPSVVYLSRQVADGFEIERWTTTDGGARWRHEVVVPAGGTDNVRPVVPRGWDHGPMSLLWLRGHYGSYTALPHIGRLPALTSRERHAAVRRVETVASARARVAARAADGLCLSASHRASSAYVKPKTSSPPSHQQPRPCSLRTCEPRKPSGG